MAVGRPRKFNSREDVERALNTALGERGDISDEIEELLDERVKQTAVLTRLRAKRKRVTLRIADLDKHLKRWDEIYAPK